MPVDTRVVFGCTCDTYVTTVTSTLTIRNKQKIFKADLEKAAWHNLSHGQRDPTFQSLITLFEVLIPLFSCQSHYYRYNPTLLLL